MSFVSKINSLEELFECPVCMEKLGYTNKVLPCQHTFCIRCICQIYYRNYDNLRCPECRKVYKGKIEDLPANIFLIRMLDKIREMKNAIPVVENKKNFSTINNNPLARVQGGLSLNPASLSKRSQPHNERRQNQPLTAERSWLTRNIASASSNQAYQRSILKATRRLPISEFD